MYGWPRGPDGTPQELFETPRSIPFVGYFSARRGNEKRPGRDRDRDKAVIGGHEIALGSRLCAGWTVRSNWAVRPEFNPPCHGEAGLPVTIKRIEGRRPHKICAADFKTAPKSK